MTTETDIQEASRELVEALQLKPHEAAELTAQYHELKTDYLIVMTATGERLKQDEYDRRVKDLNKQLRQYIEDQGTDDQGRYMTIDIEGLPPLELQPRGADDCDLPALLEAEPDVFFALVAARQVRVDCKTGRSVLNPDQASRFGRFVHKIGLTPSLAFRKVAR